MTLEIKIGHQSFPVVSVAKIENENDLILVFINDGIFWGQSITHKTVAPLKFRSGKTVWGGKVVKFI